ncbi:MAG: hypothetical protein COS84_00580 [Armatimonadetes bacterium CG07_land_8_20_14_0_80_40_9]|nr:MAG: hypothetical protein COS84_00580 [Armatimonadetes bacterium CG07_land_8_20_14_0_80_40_9]
MAKRYILPSIFFVLLLLISLSNCSYAQKGAELTTNERLIRLETKMEEGFKALNQRIDDTNRRIDDLDRKLSQRIDDLHSFMNIMFGFIIAVLIFMGGTMVGLYRTMVGLYRRFSRLEGILEERKEVELKEVRFEKVERGMEELRGVVKAIERKLASS